MSWPDPLAIAQNRADGQEVVYRFGINEIGTAYAPLSSSGVQHLPPPSGARALHVSSTSAADTVAGSGARYVLLTGLDAVGNEVQEVVAMNGTSDSAETTVVFWRLLTALVVASGTYSQDGANSYAGEITVSDAEGTDWGFIESGGALPSPGAWQSSFYTVPANKTAVVFDVAIGEESTKAADLVAKFRLNADNEADPSSWVEATRFIGIDQVFIRPLAYPFAGLAPLTDFGVWGEVQNGTGYVSCGYGMVLKRGR